MQKQYNFVGDTYLLFANSYHINRVSVDGTSFEILYDDPFFGGIVGLDFNYRYIHIATLKYHQKYLKCVLCYGDRAN